MSRRRSGPREQEHHVQERIVDLLEFAGAVVVENRSQKWDALATAMAARSDKARKRAKGQVDLIVAIPGGYTLWIEVKNGKDGQISEDQFEKHQALRARGHLVIVARDHDDLITWAEVTTDKTIVGQQVVDFARKLMPANG